MRGADDAGYARTRRPLPLDVKEERNERTTVALRPQLLQGQYHANRIWGGAKRIMNPLI